MRSKNLDVHDFHRALDTPSYDKIIELMRILKTSDKGTYVDIKTNKM